MATSELKSSELKLEPDAVYSLEGEPESGAGTRPAAAT